MIERLVGWSIRHRRLVVGLTVLGALAGIVAAANLRFDALPDVTGRQVIVLTGAPGLSPEEVELRVTRSVEMALGGLPELETLRSISRYGISSVTAVFDEGTDLLRARQLVQERLGPLAGSLPEGVGAPTMAPLTGGLGEIYQFTLRSDHRTTAELLALVELRVAPLLRSVRGVVEVNTWGGERRTLEVVGDPRRMSQRGVTLAELTRAVEATSGQVPGSVLEAGEMGVVLRGVARPRGASDLAGAVIRPGEAMEAPVRIGDVAEVRDGALPRIGAATADGRGEVVYVMVQMLLDDNALEVVSRVKERAPAVRAALPEDVELEVVYDRSELVSATLRTVFINLGAGGFLVVLVLFAMLGSFRAGLLVASVIPLSMLGALTGMWALDVPGNLMSLGAIDFGLLVNGAVVMVESVFLRAALRGGPFEARAEEALGRMSRPVFFSVLIVTLVYVPILSLTGVEGRMYRPMAIAVVLALGSALILSLTFVPAATRLLLRARDVPRTTPWLVRAAARVHRPLLDVALARPVVVGAGAIGLLVLGGVLWGRAGSAFMPQLDEGDLVVQTLRESNIRIEAAAEAASRLEAAVLSNVPEVRHVATRTGSPAVATDIMGIEQADVFIDIAPRDEWRAGLSREGLIEEIAAAIERAAPADEVVFTQPIQMRFNELVGGEVSDVALSIYGEDLETLQGLARDAKDILEGVSGAVDVRITAPPSIRVLEVRPRSLEAARHGLSAEDVLGHVRAARTGLDAGDTFEGPLRIPLRVRYGVETEALLFEELPLATPAGALVPLREVALVSREIGPALVNHHETQRRIVVGFNVREADLGTVYEEARGSVEGALELPTAYRIGWGGQAESLASARARLAIVVPIVLTSILGLLWANFGSLRPATVIFLQVPFAAVGGVVALAIAGLPISVSSAVGFIALSGMAVLNGVVLMNGILDAEGEGSSPAESARRVAGERMRPVLMTASTDALGFVPMMLATGVGAEIQRPLATVIVGGIVTSTLLTLVILPALHPWFAGWLGRGAKA